ncbi:hypothetical protein V5799_026097 [Amblyomma americanum]|uniref:Uncharacterized protein n=1 Tax=Amblyomma americanum TaxID=6943 RepID=A0AAQ4DJJ5_AMBAM
MHTRNQLRIEVADFDFNEPSSDDLVEKTFADRLRSALLQALLGVSAEDAENGSNMSASPASSIRHPVASSREELHLAYPIKQRQLPRIL